MSIRDKVTSAFMAIWYPNCVIIEADIPTVTAWVKQTFPGYHVQRDPAKNPWRKSQAKTGEKNIGFSIPERGEPLFTNEGIIE
jgi:hypothetical protein